MDHALSILLLATILAFLATGAWDRRWLRWLFVALLMAFVLVGAIRDKMRADAGIPVEPDLDEWQP